MMFTTISEWKKFLETNESHKPKVNECYENARVEYNNRKASGENVEYYLGYLYSQSQLADKGQLPISHAWVVKDGNEVIDTTPFKFGLGPNTSDLPERSASEEFPDAEYIGKQIPADAYAQLEHVLKYFPKISDPNFWSSIHEMLKNRSSMLESRVKQHEKVDIYRDDRYVVVRPLNERASCKYGAFTKWCISAPGSAAWEGQTDDTVVIMILDSKYEMSPAKRAIVNEYNRIKDLIDDGEELDDSGEDLVEMLDNLRGHDMEDLRKIALVGTTKRGITEIWDANNIDITHNYSGFMTMPVDNKVLEAIDDYVDELKNHRMAANEAFRVPDATRRQLIDMCTKAAAENDIRTEGDFIILFHGTSRQNMTRIVKTSRLNKGTWLTGNIEEAKRYALTKGTSPVVDTFAVYMGSLVYNGYFSTQEDLFLKDGHYAPLDYKPVNESTNTDGTINFGSPEKDPSFIKFLSDCGWHWPVTKELLYTGLCGLLAVWMLSKVKGAGRVFAVIFSFGVGHAIVKIGDRYYDGLNPEGCKEMADMKIFKLEDSLKPGVYKEYNPESFFKELANFSYDGSDDDDKNRAEMVNNYMSLMESVQTSLTILTEPLENIVDTDYPIGEGNSNTVYELIGDDTKVVRHSRDGINVAEYEHFNAHQDRFPKVYGINMDGDYAVLEKLDTDEVKHDLVWIGEELEDLGWTLTEPSDVDDLTFVSKDIR